MAITSTLEYIVIEEGYIVNEIREIVTKAVVGKGKKIIRIKDALTPVNEIFSILGCWVINHTFQATLIDNKVKIVGEAELDIWYSYDNNTKTDVARKVIEYTETIKTRQLVQEICSDERDVIVKILQEPTCTNACIKENEILVDIIFEAVAEVIGETKMLVPVCAQVNDPIDDDFENEINEDFIRQN